MTIEAYEPVIPAKKKFGYPQLQDEVRPLGMREKAASDDERRISTQPKHVNYDELAPIPISRSRSIDTSINKKLKGSMGLRSSSIVEGLKPGSRIPKPLKTFSVAKGDPSVSVTSPKTPKKLIIAPHHATLQFNLYYDTHRASLNVHIHQGLYFPQKKSVKSTDSYIKAILLPSRKQTLRTRIIINSRSPAFDEILEFSGPTLEELNGQTLVLQLFYRSHLGDKYISSCFTKLRYINLLESNHLTKRIDEGMGLLEVSSRYTNHSVVILNPSIQHNTAVAS